MPALEHQAAVDITGGGKRSSASHSTSGHTPPAQMEPPAWDGPGSSPLWPLAPHSSCSHLPLDVAEAVLSHVSATTLHALRLVDRSARDLIDSCTRKLRISGAQQAATLRAAAHRLRALRSLEFRTSDEAGIYALREALPSLGCLTCLVLKEDGVSSAQLIRGEWAQGLACQITSLVNLQRLEVCILSSRSQCFSAIVSAAAGLRQLRALVLPLCWADGAQGALAQGSWQMLQARVFWVWARGVAGGRCERGQMACQEVVCCLLFAVFHQTCLYMHLQYVFWVCFGMHQSLSRALHTLTSTPTHMASHNAYPHACMHACMHSRTSMDTVLGSRHIHPRYNSTHKHATLQHTPTFNAHTPHTFPK